MPEALPTTSPTPPRDFSLLDHIPSGILILDSDFNILYWNRCLEQWTRRGGREMVGTSLFSHYPELESPRYLHRITDIFRGGPTTIFSSQLHKHFIPASLPGGRQRVQYTVVTGLPAEREGEYLALFSIQDVTDLTDAINNYGVAHRKLIVEMEERRKVEEELQRSSEELKRLNHALNESSIRDGLTDVYNHRYFWQILRRDFLMAERHEHELSCLIIDLDYFKRVNDTYGHLFGDRILKGVAKRIRERIRETDLVCRYGGEEFTVLLPNTDLSGASIIAENIRSGLEKSRFRKGAETVRVTVSIGVASLLRHRPDSPQQLLDYADSALYRAKDTGRNRVCLYAAEPHPQ